MSSRRILLMSCLAAALTASTVGAEPPKPREGPLGMKFVSLPKGTFYMGWDGEMKGVKTEIKEDFEIAVYTVTQGQWQEIMGNNPSWFSRDGGGKDKVKDVKDEDLKQFPVELVSWNNAQEFIKKLNEKEKGKGWTYRLPKEAEISACQGAVPLRRKNARITSTSRSRRTTSRPRTRTSNGHWPDGKADGRAVPGLRRRWARMRPNKAGSACRRAWQRVAMVQRPVANGFPATRAAWRRGAGCSLFGRCCRSALRGGDVPVDWHQVLRFRLAAEVLRLEPSEEKASNAEPFHRTERSGGRMP